MSDLIDYDEIVAEVIPIIEGTGDDCIIALVTPIPVGEQDVEKPWLAVPTTNRIEVKALFYSPKEKMIGGSLVSVGEEAVMCAPTVPALNRQKTVGSKIIRNGVTYTINSFELLKPGPTELLYTFKVAL